MEERSRQMLISAQRDAQECIKYFKDLAYQAQASAKNSERPRNHSHSPVLKNKAIDKKKPEQAMISRNPMLREATKEKGMPQSLGPV